MNRRFRLLIVPALVAAGLAGSAAAGPAPFAGSPGASPTLQVTVRVDSHGLDLASPAGADRFLRRLNAAVTRACDDRPIGSSVFLARSPGFHACRAGALEAAITEVYAPVVRQRYAELRRTDDDLRLARR